MPAPLTNHARVRMQQRGIPCAALDVLLDYGAQCHDHRGCLIVRFDKRSRARAARALPATTWHRLERYFDTYAVVGPDDAVITVGHRSRRRHES